ncbi:MAG: glycosyltransferase family 9 protein [Selenomonadaceae bacterium]|nr:glycosyltransferase family 9 protein [Selenomonadaceae bacterium]
MFKKILVINLMHLGDLMLVTPALRTLRKNFPTAHLALLADKKLADLVQYNKNIDECILIDKKGADDHLISFVKFIFKIREKNFDLVINLHRNERASAIAAFSGAKKIVGYSKPGFSIFFDKVMPNPSIAQQTPHYVPGSQHQVKSHFDVLIEAVGVNEIDDGGLEMWIPKAVEDETTKIFNETFGEDSKVIAFNIGASWLTKRWIDSYFAECADRLIEKNFSIAFLGGSMDIEIVNTCISKIKNHDSDKIKIFTGKLSLAQVAAVLDNCVLFLTTDSGPMHIGVARNIPIVTMFGASPVPGFYPYDAKDILIKAPVDCHPCGQHTCPRQGEDNLACMKKISVNVVMKYVEEMLNDYGQRAKDIPKIYGKYKCRVVEI